MKLRSLLGVGCVSVAMATAAFPAVAAAPHECVAGTVTAASYTWNFKGEANTLFKDVQAEAQDAEYHADQLQSLARDPLVDWQAHVEQLNSLKTEINDIGDKLCRLETIRSATAPWQRREIDRIAIDERLMADNAQDAIVFGSSHTLALWLPTYRTYVRNMSDLSRKLTSSVDSAVEFSGVSKEYRDLGSKLGVRASS